MSDEKPYKMTLTLDILDHLGLNLYSNIPAVLAEAVANAWDADATRVEINLDGPSGRVVIADDGSGMTQDEINTRYLTVGYKRRDHHPVKTAKYGRHVMGRKGIGKLSLFSIADDIEVQSVKEENGELERSAFQMLTEEIRSQMKAMEGTYFPSAIEPDPSLDAGTRIGLGKLKKKITATTGKALRRRLARRFAVIGPANNFEVVIDGDPIGPGDRDYFSKVEYLWSIGDVGSSYADLCVNAKAVHSLSGVVDPDQGYEIRGWIGTFDEQKNIEDENNSVSVLAWGKLVQEDILREIREGGLFSKYLIGEINADFLDLDEEVDIATSDRQRLKEDDSRVELLRAFVKDSLLKPIGSAWRDLRNQNALDKAMTNPAVKEWFATLDGDAKTQAKKLFGRIGSLGVEDEESRRELYRHAILAFERLRFRDALSVIDALGEAPDFSALEKAFVQIDDLEAAQFHQIARGRLEVIEHFANIAEGEKEKVIQHHLFKHLWLLDPSWERVPTSAKMEEAVKKEFDGIDAKLSKKEKAGRVDIRYATAAGKHVIIELKKYDVSVKIGALIDQVQKYHGALEKLLVEKVGDSSPHIEVIVVVGKRPKDPSNDKQDQSLAAAVNGRLITYDQLIEGAQKAYAEYLEAGKEISRVSDLLEKI